MLLMLTGCLPATLTSQAVQISATLQAPGALQLAQAVPVMHPPSLGTSPLQKQGRLPSPCVVPHACWLLLQAIQLVNTLTKELDIHAAMESVRHVALELLQCERVTLFLVIESRQELRCAGRLAA